MKRRDVIQVLEERTTEFNGVPMYEMKMLVDDYGNKHTVDVVLMEEDYNMIKEKRILLLLGGR